jgi:hypothetical protein
LEPAVEKFAPPGYFERLEKLADVKVRNYKAFGEL